jgi:hypothetical protein
MMPITVEQSIETIAVHWSPTYMDASEVHKVT